MRALRATAAVITAIGATFAFAAPASATTYSVTSPAGDVARWNSDTNTLTVCDNSSGNGTAKAKLVVIGGNTWEKFDDNGAQAGCGSAGPLGVDESKSAYLYVCTNASGACYGVGPVDL
jgi:hypothetical protein